MKTDQVREIALFDIFAVMTVTHLTFTKSVNLTNKYLSPQTCNALKQKKNNLNKN